MTDELHNEVEEEDFLTILPSRELTPTRILQVKMIGAINALYNYLQWLKDKDRERKDNER